MTQRALAALFATCCSAPAPVDAPPSEPTLPACSSVSESSCDGGWAACSIDGECWCYRGPEMVACAVPCRIDFEPSCHAVGCDGFDTFECSTATGECWCERDGEERVACELETCGQVPTV